MEGADVAIFYNENTEVPKATRSLVENTGRRCVVIQGDVRNSDECRAAVAQTISELGGLNLLVNNAAYQMAQEKFENVSKEQFRRTLETNI